MGFGEGMGHAAEAILREEIDGTALAAYSSRLEVKQNLQIPGGKAARLWEAIQGLRAGGSVGDLSQLPQLSNEPARQLSSGADDMIGDGDEGCDSGNALQEITSWLTPTVDTQLAIWLGSEWFPTKGCQTLPDGAVIVSLPILKGRWWSQSPGLRPTNTVDSDDDPWKEISEVQGEFTTVLTNTVQWRGKVTVSMAEKPPVYPAEAIIVEDSRLDHNTLKVGTHIQYGKHRFSYEGPARTCCKNKHKIVRDRGDHDTIEVLLQTGVNSQNWSLAMRQEAQWQDCTLKGWYECADSSMGHGTMDLSNMQILNHVKKVRLRNERAAPESWRDYDVVTLNCQAVHVSDVGSTTHYLVQCDKNAAGLEQWVQKSAADLEFLFQVRPQPQQQQLVPARVSRSIVSFTPLLILGDAACGKSTLTRQCMHSLAKDATHALDKCIVPYRVAVVDLAKTLRSHPDTMHERADILKLHILAQEQSYAKELLNRRDKFRLMVMVDGIDEAGDTANVLEPYLLNKLSREVFLCITGRKNGVSQKFRAQFCDPSRFITMEIANLSTSQQLYMVRERLSVRPVEGTTLPIRIRTFMQQLERCAPQLGKTPMLLNLMLSEFMLHETTGPDIRFNGRIVAGQRDYVASFPGVEKRPWDRVTRVLKGKSVACVWLPPDSDLHGKHYADPRNDGKCFCQTFLYNDLPNEVRQKDPFKMIMSDSDVHVWKSLPAVGQKVEVSFCTVEKGWIKRWWICSVLSVDAARGGVTVKSDGRTDLKEEYLLWDTDARINRSGIRKTNQQVGQAPFGCEWFHKWSDNVISAEAYGQQAIVVFKTGQKGQRETPAGLGASQMKELQYLERNESRGVLGVPKVPSFVNECRWRRQCACLPP
eukprot:SAG25_NODE_489_length_7429_cov_45.504638_1_plen_872_part_10